MIRCVLFALAFALTAARARDAFAFCRTTTPRTPPGACEPSRTVSWPVTCVALSLNTRALSPLADAGQPLEALLRRHLAPAARAWSSASCGAVGTSFALSVTDDVDAPLDLALDGRNVVSVNRRWSPDLWHRPGTIAFTVITVDVPTASILEADVELNALAMENPLGREFGDGAPVWGVADAPSVLLHELGHVVGLDHSLDPDAVMAPGTSVERQRRALTADDVRGACALHPVTAARRAPLADCTPERVDVPPIRPTARGGSCAVGDGRRPHPSAISVMLATLALRRRRNRTSPTQRTIGDSP